MKNKTLEGAQALKIHIAALARCHIIRPTLAAKVALSRFKCNLKVPYIDLSRLKSPKIALNRLKSP